MLARLKPRDWSWGEIAGGVFILLATALFLTAAFGWQAVPVFTLSMALLWWALDRWT